MNKFITYQNPKKIQDSLQIEYMRNNEEQYFPTEAFISQRKMDEPNALRAILKIKQLKNHVNQLKSYHQRALSDRVRTQKSIGEISRSSQKIKVSFLKLYQNKKMRLMNRQKIQNKKMEDRDHLGEMTYKIKQQKLMSQLQMEATRNQEDQKNQMRKEQLRRQKQKTQKEIKLNKLEQYMSARAQYNKLKDYKSETMIRNKKLTEIMDIRCRLNYAEKAEKQLEQVKEYEKLLEELNKIEKQQAEFRPYTANSKSFFVTNHLNQVQKTEQKPVSTRGTYRARNRHR